MRINNHAHKDPKYTCLVIVYTTIQCRTTFGDEDTGERVSGECRFALDSNGVVTVEKYNQQNIGRRYVWTDRDRVSL